MTARSSPNDGLAAGFSSSAQAEAHARNEYSRWQDESSLLDSALHMFRDAIQAAMPATQAAPLLAALDAFEQMHDVADARLGDVVIALDAALTLARQRR